MLASMLGALSTSCVAPRTLFTAAAYCAASPLAGVRNISRSNSLRCSSLMAQREMAALVCMPRHVFRLGACARDN